MRLVPSAARCAALLLAAVAVSPAALSPRLATAEEQPAPRSGAPTCTCPDGKADLWPRPKYAELRTTLLDANDEIAALESVQIALTEVGDGASYVWHRRNGRLSGVVQPTGSFKGAAGQVCRHLVVTLSSTDQTRRAEGVACRLADGRWQLEG
jgi:hypothetical protein